MRARNQNLDKYRFEISTSEGSMTVLGTDLSGMSFIDKEDHFEIALSVAQDFKPGSVQVMRKVGIDAIALGEAVGFFIKDSEDRLVFGCDYAMPFSRLLSVGPADKKPTTERLCVTFYARKVCI